MTKREEAAQWLAEYLLSGAHRGCKTDEMVGKLLALTEPKPAPEGGEFAKTLANMEGMLRCDSSADVSFERAAVLAAYENKRKRAEELAEQLSRSVGIELYDNLKADRDRLAAELAEVASLTGYQGRDPETGGSMFRQVGLCTLQRLWDADEEVLRLAAELQACRVREDTAEAYWIDRYEHLAAIVKRVKALKQTAAKDFKGYVLNTDLDAALAPQQEVRCTKCGYLLYDDHCPECAVLAPTKEIP